MGCIQFLTGRETFSRTRQLTSETGRGFFTMRKYKTTLCALLVTTSVFGYSNIISASTNRVNNVSENNATQLVNTKNEVDKLKAEKFAAVKIAEDAKIAAKKEEQAAAKKAEEARLAAEKAKKEKLAAKKAEEAKLAAQKAEKEKLAAKKAATAKKTTIAKTTKRKTVSRGAVTTTVSAEKAREIIDYGKQFMGVNYVFGGASPKGFDCSGFTMYVFNKFGISLPHSAKAQAEIGVAVSKSDLIPGDLVFFETYKPGISHVGIYIGNGNFLEASSSRGIAITSLSSSYYKNRYMGATRVLK